MPLLNLKQTSRPHGDWPTSFPATTLLPPVFKGNMRILALQFFAFLFTFPTIVNGFSNPSASNMIHLLNVVDYSFAFDFWEEARKVEDKAIRYANEQIEVIANHNTSMTEDIHDFKAAWTQVVKTVGELRPGMNTDSQLVEIHRLEDEEFAVFFSKNMEKVLKGLQAELEEPLPENQSERYKQREVVINLALNMTEGVLVEAYNILDVPEEEVREKFGHVKPHIRQSILVMGNLADNHPEIVEIILFSAAIFILPEYALLRPIVRVFGIGPIGPIKGSPAAWAQRYFFGGTIPPNSWFSKLQQAGMTKGIFDGIKRIFCGFFKFC